jgi:hypothetical protein
MMATNNKRASICLFFVLVAFFASLSAAQDTPAFLVTDSFGRDLNQRGITLVDWEGYMANPAIRLKIQAPCAKGGPVFTTISANGPVPVLRFPLHYLSRWAE